jgi:nucleoside-diphosphate-sugar epimerase
MKIFIAGGGGYVGCALIPKLIERGYDIEVIDLFWFGRHLPEGAKTTRKDVFDVKESELRGVDQVIFLAGLSNDPMAEYSPSKNFVGNAAAPAYLGYIAKRAGVKRFIHAGSCSVYGYLVNELCDEASVPASTYPYGISKMQGEQAVMQLADENFSVISFRKGTISGYSPRMRLDLVVNTMFKSAMADGVITVNNPSIWRPILSIQDAVSAYIRAIEAPNISGIFNIASGNYTVGEIADRVLETLAATNNSARLEIKHIPDYRSYKVNIDKATNVLSFKPKRDVEAIVHELLENRQHFCDWENPNYYNIRVFKSIDNGHRP